MKKIKWKKAKGGLAFEHLLEGFIDGEKKSSFMIEGRGCVTDLRPIRGEVWGHPKHYRLNSNGPDVKGEAKGIASDLLNGLNVDKHQANWQRGEDETAHTIKVMKEAQDFIDSLTKRKNK